MADANFRIKLHKAQLNVRHIKVLDSWQQSFEQELIKKNAEYILDVYSTISYVIRRGMLTYSIHDVLNTSFLPNFVIVALCKQDVSQGSYTASPFCFETNGVQSLYFTLDGFQLPSRVFKPVFAEGASQNYTREYLSLFSGSSQFSQTASFIDYDKFGEHYCLFLVNFNQPSKCRDKITAKKMTTCSLTIDFVNDSNDPLKMYIFSQQTQL